MKSKFPDLCVNRWTVGSIPATKGGGHSDEVTIPVSAHGGCLANDVGYESEPSFNRAFKREFRVPPA